MTNYAQRLREKRYSHNAVIAKFERTLTRLPRALYLFFEGLLDRAAYAEEVTRRTPGAEVQCMLCDGKIGVQEMLAYVRKKYGKIPNAIFFVDRDFDDFIRGNTGTDELLYITDGYSVESEFCSKEALGALLRTVFCLEVEEREISVYLDRYRRAECEFARLFLPIAAWVIAIKRLGGVVRVDNVRMGDIVRVDSGGIPQRRKGALSRFCAQSDPNLALLNLCTVRTIIREVKQTGLRTYVRGKYALWFLLRFVDVLKGEWTTLRPEGERGLFIDATVDDSTIVSLLSGRMMRVASLRNFLDRTVPNYVAWLEAHPSGSEVHSG